jgi:hypothetical protein
MLFPRVASTTASSTTMFIDRKTEHAHKSLAVVIER